VLLPVLPSVPVLLPSELLPVPELLHVSVLLPVRLLHHFLLQ
jgi:hypothetical protein